MRPVETSRGCKPELGCESPVVNLAVVEQDRRIRVGSDRERSLTNAGADQGPRLALPMPEADPAVAEVVR